MGVNENGKHFGSEAFLAVDLSIKASGERYKLIMLYVWAMVAVYPVGVTSILFVLLWTRRHEIEGRTTRRGGPELSSLSFIFRLYSRR